ncbi:MAG: DUF4080 domain-containing protein [Clostridia bacterium]|nr:DUF4080 domain-containing protein [Clostridia bacterium]
MKVVLFALNSSYSHTNLAIRCLRPPLESGGFDVRVKEGNLRDTDGALLDILAAEGGDIYGFSCYIWNIDATLSLASDLKKLLPRAKTILGGPEVSYDAERFDGLGFIDHIVCGEGEEAMAALCRDLRDGKVPPRVIKSESHGLTEGVLYREGETDRRLFYYESSRGCPYSCAYCLSSATSGVIAKSAEQTLDELYEFERFGGDITVKLVDRTFNFDKKRANAVWRGLLDEKYTKKYHFEICASLLDEESFDLLSRFPSGKVQLEVGLQSVNANTLASCARHIDPESVLTACRRITDMGNVHLHLDLICGLPGDSFDSVGEAFDRAYSACSLLQVGFLKLLCGTALRRDADALGIKYRDRAPYEVLSTPDIGYFELRRLHEISDLLERYRDGGGFGETLAYGVSLSGSPFGFFCGLERHISERDGRPIRKIGQNDAYRLLYSYIASLDGCEIDRLDTLLHADYARSEVRRVAGFKISPAAK